MTTVPVLPSIDCAIQDPFHYRLRLGRALTVPQPFCPSLGAPQAPKREPGWPPRYEMSGPPWEVGIAQTQAEDAF